MSYITRSRTIASIQLEKKMVFKQVKPHAAFCNGKKVDITQINVVSVADNLVDAVTFRYTLNDEQGVFAGDGTFSLDETNYTEWDASAAGAYRLVCAGIGLELVEEAGG
jgi:hypothetical protein